MPDLIATGIWACTICGRVARKYKSDKAEIWKCLGCARVETSCSCKKLPEKISFGQQIERDRQATHTK